MKKTAILVVTLLVMASVCLIFLPSGTDADPEPPERKVLMDKGNGQTYWAVASGSTLDAVFAAAFSENGMTFSSSGSTVTVDGLTSRTIGDSVCRWNYYTYTASGWVKSDYNGSSSYSDTYVAIGFYPDNLTPTVTPQYKNAWTCIHGDSLNSGSYANYEPSTVTASLQYTYGEDDPTVPSCYASPLYANGDLILLSAEYKGTPSKAHMISINLEERTVNWDNTYNSNGYALMTGAIYGNSAYFTSVSGWVYRIPLYGENAGTITDTIRLPVTVPTEVEIEGGTVVMTGLSSIVYDSGHLFIGSSSGQMFCLTPDLQQVWSYQMTGEVYPSTSVTVTNGLVYVGACDGKLYILDEATGALKNSLLIYYNDGGRVGTPAVLGEYIILSYNDGKGMSSSLWGAAVLRYNIGSNLLNIVSKLTDVPIQSNYMVIPPTGNFVYALGVDGSGDPMLYRIYTNGGYEQVFAVEEIHGGLTLVDNTYFYGIEYISNHGTKKNPQPGYILVYNMLGEVVNRFAKPVSIMNYSMASMFVAGGFIGAATDSGAFALKGALVNGSDPPGPDPPGPDPPGPTPPEPQEASVKFLLCDGTEFYFTIEGTGVKVIDALVDAVDKYNYSDYVVYSGTATQPEGLKTFFGLTYKQISSTEYQYWMTFEWDSASDYWTTSSDTMNQMFAEDNPAVLLYYGITDGMVFEPPPGLPKEGDLQPLTQSDDGVRFLIESNTGAFFLINGTGNTLRDALENACTTNKIPYEFDGDTVTFFGKAAASGNAWNQYSADSSGWSLDTSSMSSQSASGVKAYALYYGLSSTLPSIAVDEIYDGNLSNNTEDYAPIIVAIVVAVIIIAFLVYLYRKAKTHNMTMVGAFKDMIKPSNTTSKTKQNKIRLLIVCILGLILTVVMFLCSLSIGPSVTLSLPETFKALISAIGKGGKDLTFQEIVVYQTRLPRTLAVLAVGIGLSIAGCVYQAIIRNPLVDPYIMGVSSGAGTFAVAAIAADFTFFGLLSTTTYATPILAIVGGLLAFGLTLLIAEKAGGSSTNYVLAGVVIGLVFSAIQTVLLVTAKSNKLTSAISWLFGSFANVGWDTVWIIVFPALLLSLVPLVWAKELNLVLLGEDQARQMGLNVRKFNRWMLILASVLTSVCVAFVGIIGFVGMVIPHLCRMILGGDHRLVLPSSIIMGGALLLFADLMAKMIMIPTELPVGAITTIIGVPVFAYLLIKKGRMYSG